MSARVNWTFFNW